MDNILLKFRAKFIDEANSLLDNLEKDLLQLEKSPEDKPLIEPAFRAMHTIKGVSGMYGFDAISEYTHQMESIYQAIRDKKMGFNRNIFDISFASIDHIRKLLADEKVTSPETTKNHELLLGKIQNILGDTPKLIIPPTIEPIASETPVVQNSTFNILLKSNEQLYFRGISILAIFRDLANLGSFIIEKIPNLSNDNTEMWSVFLTTGASLSNIEEILMFIEDDCIVKKVASGKLEGKSSEAKFNENDTADISINTAVQNGYNEKVQTPTISNVSEEQDNNEAKNSDEPTIQVNTKQSLKRISVDADKLDHLMFLVSELITVNSQLIQDVQNPAYDALRTKIEKIDNLSKLFRNNAIEIRLVPLSDTILRFQRLVRDLSTHLNKKIELKTQGIEVELDKNTVDQLAEPLMHIIRNSIDHGIETPELRKAKGKSETGTIEITAYQSGNYIYISIKDDGSGIDLEKIKTKAIEKGVIKATDVLSKNELLEIIFKSGFSTAKSLTDVSGRGVGMDIVRKKITDLRGEVMVESEAGDGTTFTLKIQQSLSILDSLLFMVENCYFTIPVSEIETCEHIDIENIENNRHTSTINYNDDLITFVDLRKALNIKGKYNKKPKEIIIRNNAKIFAILADKIIGEHQAVLKPLGKAFKNQSLIAAASQLGDGHIAFMLDSNSIAKNIVQLT